MQRNVAAADHFQQKLADIAVSVILGLSLLAMVSLADALQIFPTKGATVREILRFANQYTDLPQWWWIALYALLTAASMLFAWLLPQRDRLPVEVTFSLLSRDDTHTQSTIQTAANQHHRPTSPAVLNPSRDSSTTKLLTRSA
jgi:hypothetical protein